MMGQSRRKPWSRWSYAVAVLTVAAMIAAPTLVSAQSSSDGDDQMFTSVPLCKIIDSRNWDTSQYHSGKPMAGNDYDFAIRGPSEDMSNQGGDSSGCGIPDSADAVLINILAAFADGGGNMKAFASDNTASNVSGAVINFQGNLDPNLNIGNAVTIPMDTDTTNEADITIRPQLNDTHIIGTVMGYYENVTDGFYTEAESDFRFARHGHGHDAVEAHENSTQTVDASSEAVIASTTITLNDNCSGAEGWQLDITGWTDLRESDDVDFEIVLDLTNVSSGETERIAWSDADAQFGDPADGILNLYNLKTEVLLTDQDVDGDGTRGFIGSGDWTVDLVGVNQDGDDSTSVEDANLIVESRGYICLILFSSNDVTSEDTTGPEPNDETETGN